MEDSFLDKELYILKFLKKQWLASSGLSDILWSSILNHLSKK